MRISKLAWVGTRTENAEPTVAFFGDVLGLRLLRRAARSPPTSAVPGTVTSSSSPGGLATQDDV